MGEPLREGGYKMTSNLRFTISVDAETAVKLDRLKQLKYYNTTRSQMVQDLIALGLKKVQKDYDLDSPIEDGIKTKPEK